MAKTEEFAFTSEQLQLLVAEVAKAAVQSAQASGGLTADVLREIVQSAKPPLKENPDYSEVTPMTYPEGEVKRPKPRLARPTYFCGGREREETLKIEEIEAYNAIQRSCSTRGGLWVADVMRNGTEEVLKVQVPSKSLDQRMELPSLLTILQELRTGQPMLTEADYALRIAALEGQVAAMAPAQ